LQEVEAEVVWLAQVLQEVVVEVVVLLKKQ
jgi:hypothetical protein